MQRFRIKGRANKAEKLEAVGLSFHGWDNYWNEDACYKFTAKQVDELEAVTNELNEMCLTAVQHVIDNNRFAELGIPEAFWEPIKQSWNRDDFTLYGRFDLAYDGVNPPKMLEYNADTPTSLLESAVAQWYWLEDVQPKADQFNSLHERLVERWKQLPASIDTIHFASINENEEDWVCTHYLMETAIQAGYKAEHVFVEAIGFDHNNNIFVDGDDKPIQALFKLYPWEWMMREEFGKYTINSKTKFVEPMWKSVLSNKGILAILWELFPGHENLLPTYFKPTLLKDYAKKPFFSREGANIELVRNGEVFAKDVGPYGSEGYIYQQLVELKSYTDPEATVPVDPENPEGEQKPMVVFPIIGAWTVGGESAGMCIREDVLQITTNMSNFIPHYFE